MVVRGRGSGFQTIPVLELARLRAHTHNNPSLGTTKTFSDITITRIILISGLLLPSEQTQHLLLHPRIPSKSPPTLKDFCHTQRQRRQPTASQRYRAVRKEYDLNQLLDIEGRIALARDLGLEPRQVTVSPSSPRLNKTASNISQIDWNKVKRSRNQTTIQVTSGRP